jgi:hypothetical protein
MVTLVLCAVLAAEEAADAPLVSERPVASLSLRELKDEYRRLDENRPGLGGPISMLATGTGLLLSGTLNFLIYSSGPGGIGALFTSGSYVAGFLFGSMLLVGAGLLIPGIFVMKSRAAERAVMSARMDEVQERIDELEPRGRPEEPYPEPAPTPEQQRAAETYQL